MSIAENVAAIRAKMDAAAIAHRALLTIGEDKAVFDAAIVAFAKDAATATAPAPTPPDRRGPELRPCDSLPPLLLVSRGVTGKKSFPRGRLQGGGSDQTSPQRRGSSGRSVVGLGSCL